MSRIVPAAVPLALVAVAAGLIVSPARTWASLLIASFGALGFGLAGTLFLALEQVTGSAWSAALRRVPEAMTQAVYAGSAGMIVTLLAGAGKLYSWVGEPPHGFKGWWLNYPFFIGRALVFMAVWIVLTRAIVRRPRAGRLSALFIVAFALTFWLASYDWLMALDPHFVSSIFGVYQFAGMFQAGLAAIIVLAVWLDRQNVGFRLRTEHLHDLGKLLFAFSTFWMYIWFSQYMLIWYANLTEEAGYFAIRTRGGWGVLFLATMVLNWCVPFVVLLPKRTKKDARTLAKVAMVVLLGRCLDLYVAVMPSVVADRPVPGIIEMAVALGAVAVVWLEFRRGLAKARIIPAEDPFVKESLTYHA